MRSRLRRGATRGAKLHHIPSPTDPKDSIHQDRQRRQLGFQCWLLAFVARCILFTGTPRSWRLANRKKKSRRRRRTQRTGGQPQQRLMTRRGQSHPARGRHLKPLRGCSRCWCRGRTQRPRRRDPRGILIAGPTRGQWSA